MTKQDKLDAIKSLHKMIIELKSNPSVESKKNNTKFTTKIRRINTMNFKIDLHGMPINKAITKAESVLIEASFDKNMQVENYYRQIR